MPRSQALSGGLSKPLEVDPPDRGNRDPPLGPARSSRVIPTVIDAGDRLEANGFVPEMSSSRQGQFKAHRLTSLVEQPAKFELVINMKTAKQLRLAEDS